MTNCMFYVYNKNYIQHARTWKFFSLDRFLNYYYYVLQDEVVHLSTLLRFFSFMNTRVTEFSSVGQQIPIST